MAIAYEHELDKEKKSGNFLMIIKFTNSFTKDNPTIQKEVKTRGAFAGLNVNKSTNHKCKL